MGLFYLWLLVVISHGAHVIFCFALFVMLCAAGCYFYDPANSILLFEAISLVAASLLIAWEGIRDFRAKKKR